MPSCKLQRNKPQTTYCGHLNCASSAGLHAGRGGRRNAPEVEDANGAISRNGGEDTDPAPGDVMHFPIVGDQLCVNHSHLQPAEANLNAYCCVRLSVEWCVVLDLMTGALSVGRGLSSTACLRLLALLIPKAKFKLLHVAEIRQQIEVIKVSIDPHNLGLVMWTCDSQMWAEEVRGGAGGGGWVGGTQGGRAPLYPKWCTWCRCWMCPSAWGPSRSSRRM